MNTTWKDPINVPMVGPEFDSSEIILMRFDDDERTVRTGFAYIHEGSLNWEPDGEWPESKNGSVSVMAWTDIPK